MIEAVNPSSPASGDFVRELKAKRSRLGLTRNAAARRAGLAPNTWSLVERGYRVAGGSKIDYPPSFSFVIKAARALEWDFTEALTKAGIEFDPDNLPPVDEINADQDTFLELLGGMVPMQRKALFSLMRTMQDPFTDVEQLLAS